MHPALHRDIWIRNSRGQQFSNRPQNKNIPSCHITPALARCPAALNQEIFQLLEYSVLQYRIDD